MDDTYSLIGFWLMLSSAIVAGSVAGSRFDAWTKDLKNFKLVPDVWVYSMLFCFYVGALMAFPFLMATNSPFSCLFFAIMTLVVGFLTATVTMFLSAFLFEGLHRLAKWYNDKWTTHA